VPGLAPIDLHIGKFLALFKNQDGKITNCTVVPRAAFAVHHG
jgi:hypothetical protein